MQRRLANVGIWLLTILLALCIRSLGEQPVIGGGSASESSEENENCSLILKPKGLSGIACADDHFEYILKDIGRDPAFFGYLKNRYFTLPAVGMGTDMYPDQSAALVILAQREKAAREKLFDVLSPAGEGVTGEGVKGNAELEANTALLKQWFYLKGALAWGKRIVHRSGPDDGGQEYREIFVRAELLADYPDLFGVLVNDFCLIAPRPLRYRRNDSISCARESCRALFPRFMVLPECLPHEPRLSSLYGIGLDRPYVVSTLEQLDQTSIGSLAYLRRAGLFLSDCERGGKAELPDLACRYLRLAISHQGFEELAPHDQAMLQTRLVSMLAASGRNGDAIALQEELRSAGKTGRAETLALYEEEIKELKGRIAANAQKQSNGTEPTASDDLTARLRELEGERDSLLADAMRDFSFRPDVVPIARSLRRLKRTWECLDYLSRFIAGNETEDLAGLDAVVYLGSCLVAEADRSERLQASGQPVEPVLPPLAQVAADTPERSALAKEDIEADYREKALAVLASVNPETYAGRRDMECRAALYAWRELKSKVEASLANH